MTIFVFLFSFAGLQCYQISSVLKMIKFCQKLPLLLNMILRSLLLLCNPAKNVGPARLYKRTSNWKYGPSLNSMYKVSYTMLKEGIADLLIGVIEKSYWFWRIALKDQSTNIFSLKSMCANLFPLFLSVCLSFWQAILQQPDTCATNGKPINVPGILKWPPLHHQEMCAIL